jgi:hypothetical protein
MRFRGVKWVESPTIPLVVASVSAALAGFLAVVVVEDIMGRIAGHARPYLQSIGVAGSLCFVLTILARAAWKSSRNRRRAKNDQHVI